MNYNFSVKIKRKKCIFVSYKKTAPEFVRKQKLFRYLVSKGYKMDEVWEFINKQD